MSNLYYLMAFQPLETHIQNDKTISSKTKFFKIVFSQNINSQNNSFSYFLKKFFFIKRKRKHSKEKCSTNKKSTYFWAKLKEHTFWWWNSSKLSKNQRMSWSSSASTRTGYLFPLKFCTEIKRHCCTNGCSHFFLLLVVLYF